MGCAQIGAEEGAGTLSPPPTASEGLVTFSSPWHRETEAQSRARGASAAASGSPFLFRILQNQQQKRRKPANHKEAQIPPWAPSPVPIGGTPLPPPAQPSRCGGNFALPGEFKRRAGAARAVRVSRGRRCPARNAVSHGESIPRPPAPHRASRPAAAGRRLEAASPAPGALG